MGRAVPERSAGVLLLGDSRHDSGEASVGGIGGRRGAGWGRFGSDPRLYIVYLDEDIPVHSLKSKIDLIDITNPTEITFQYSHKDIGVKQYKTTCFVVLLSNG